MKRMVQYVRVVKLVVVSSLEREMVRKKSVKVEDKDDEELMTMKRRCKMMMGLESVSEGEEESVNEELVQSNQSSMVWSEGNGQLLLRSGSMVQRERGKGQMKASESDEMMLEEEED
jgi:hypothetical protein